MQTETTIQMPKVGEIFRSTETSRKTVWAYVLLLQVVEVTETTIQMRRINTSKPGLDMSKGGLRVETPESFAAKMQAGTFEFAY